MHGNYKKHTAIPRLEPPSLKIDRTEYERSEQTLVERILSPEELAEVIEKYGPPKMPLSDRRNVMNIPKKKRKTA